MYAVCKEAHASRLVKITISYTQGIFSSSVYSCTISSSWWSLSLSHLRVAEAVLIVMVTTLIVFLAGTLLGTCVPTNPNDESSECSFVSLKVFFLLMTVFSWHISLPSLHAHTRRMIPSKTRLLTISAQFMVTQGQQSTTMTWGPLSSTLRK